MRANMEKPATFLKCRLYSLSVMWAEAVFVHPTSRKGIS